MSAVLDYVPSKEFDAPLEMIECEQNTPLWEVARSTLVTASEFGTVMAKPKSKSDKESLTRLKYLRTLTTEIITGKPVEGYHSAAMLRGHIVEPEGRALYGFATDTQPEPVGFWKRGRVGGSPDSLIRDKRRLLELKSKAPHLMLEILAAEKMPTDHIPQIQGQLWIGRGEVDDLDLCYFCPGLKPRVFRVEPDFAYWRQLEDAIGEFLIDLDKMVAWYRSI